MSCFIRFGNVGGSGGNIWIFGRKVERKPDARGRGYRPGQGLRRGIQLRLRERALLRQGQLSEPQASSGPAAMLLAISRNLSCIPRRSPCPGRYPLPLASAFLSTFRNLSSSPDSVPPATKKAGSSAHSLQTLTQTKILTPKLKEAPTSYSQTSPQP